MSPPHNEFHDLPVCQTSQQKENISPYNPQAQDWRYFEDLPQEYPHGLTPSRDGPRQPAQQHNPRSFISYQPPQPYSAAFPRTNEPNSSSTTDLAKYLIRREMISSVLLTFDDCPEHYWAWKASFCSSMEDLNMTTREELDLLCKWLGPKSSEHAKRIRAVHIHDAAAGVKMVWERLEDCYRSPEAIETALLKKLEDFPRIANRENYRLRELGDILLELEAAKVDGFLPGQNCFDTSRGITPIVQKLPYSMHDKWVSSASRYKESHRTSYPPFSFFVKFVCDQAKTLNDPSFAPLTGGWSPGKAEQFSRHNTRVPVSVKKTQVSVELSSNRDNHPKEDIVDPDKQCPLHNKPHPLRKCRGFRSKSLDERKTCLKEKNICFRCCATCNYQAKDCKKDVRCKECNSDNILTLYT